MSRTLIDVDIFEISIFDNVIVKYFVFINDMTHLVSITSSMKDFLKIIDIQTMTY
jgi:hypothetical protein